MLVDYSDSDSESEESHSSVSTKKEKPGIDSIGSDRSKLPPPPPASFYSLYATSTRSSTSDDPTLHGGRIRQIPHTEGNWASHVYLEWYPSKTEVAGIETVISQAQPESSLRINNLLRSDLGVQLPLHISLSAPLVLRTDQRDEFCDWINKALIASNIRAFSVSPTHASWVSNFDNTRFFLVLGLGQPLSDELKRLLNLCNQCCARFGLERLYESDTNSGADKLGIAPQQKFGLNRSSAFHISVAWSLKAPSEEDKQAVLGVDLLELRSTSIAFDTVKIKIGNVVRDLKLS